MPLDFARPQAKTLRFYTKEQISPRQYRTPEGFLLCQGVPIARTGTLQYARGEVPVQADSNGLIRIHRDEGEVFHPRAVTSFAGKPVTDEHPPFQVTPETWRQHSIGVVLDPRRGDGLTEDNRFLYADLLIQDADAIQAIQQGKREVSAGYLAEYEPTGPGEGRQKNIIGNHVALVEKGRCGPMCAIGDTAEKVIQMTGQTKAPARQTRRVTADAQARRWRATRDAIMKAFHTGDEDTLVDEIDKLDDMMGEKTTGEGIGSIVSGDNGMPNIVFNLPGASGGMPTAAPGGASPVAAAGDDLDPGAAPAPPGAAGDPATQLADIVRRLSALEQAVAILANGDDPGDNDNDPDNDGINERTGNDAAPGAIRRRSTRDEIQDNTAKETEGEADVPEVPGVTKGNISNITSTGDSAARMTRLWSQVMADAEVLMPGVRRPTMDAARPPKQTLETINAFRRNVLAQAMQTEEAAPAILSCMGDNANTPIGRMTNDAVAVLFSGASSILKAQSVRQQRGQPAINRDAMVMPVTDVVRSINQRNAEYWAKGGRRA